MKCKKIGIWLIAIFLLMTHVMLRSALHAEETGSLWQKMKARSGDCSISFPSSPKMIEQSIPLPEPGLKLNYDVYLSPLDDKSLCLLLVATYPYKLKKGHELAGVEGLLKGILGQHEGNKLHFAKVIKVEGHPAIDFLVQSPTSYFRGQALMVGNKLYLIAIEGRDGAHDEEAFAQLTNSFKLSQ